MSRRVGLALCLSLLIALAVQPPSRLDAAGEAGVGARQAAPAQQPTFRSGIDIVDVDVSVLDRNRLPVRGLTAADFTVMEEGQSRPVVAFTEVELPSRERPPAPWMADVASDVSTNEVSREGRLVVVLLDRTIRMEHAPAVQAFSEAAIDQLRPGDLAAVVYADRGVPQNFTADRQRLLAAVRQPFVGLPGGDTGSPAECYCGTCSLEAVTRVAEAVQDVRQRRKMLLVVSPNMAVHSTGQCAGLLSNLRNKAVRALEASNMTVFGFDPTGLETLGFSASSPSAGNYGRAVRQQMQRRGNLRILPDHTGGRVVDDPVRPADGVAEIYRESGSYYVLGFQPASTAADGRFRDIRVRVNRKDVTLQARRGYYAPGGRTGGRIPVAGVSPDLSGAISGFWPRAGLTVTAAAAPLAMPDLRSGAVGIVLGVKPGADIPPEVVGAAASRPRTVNVLVGAFDRNGKMLAHDRRTLQLAPRAGANGAAEYEVGARLTLEPGRYEIRAAVEDAGLGEVGSVYTYVDVPDFVKTPVTLSGLLVEAEPVPQAAEGPILSDLVPVAATARRTFAATDRVRGFVRVYQGLTRAAMPGYITAEIRDTTDRIVLRQESRVLAEQLGASRAVDFTVDLPVARLAAGEYLLSVEARHGNETARRQARFTVR